MLLVVRPNDGEGGTEPLIADEDAEMRESGRGKTIIPQLSWSLPTFKYCYGRVEKWIAAMVSGFLHSQFVSHTMYDVLCTCTCSCTNTRYVRSSPCSR